MFTAQLPNRSESMVEAFYLMHREYLCLPSASAQGLCTIVGNDSVEKFLNNKSRYRKRKFSHDDSDNQKNEAKLSSAQIRACLSEWFYASIDEAYFSYNEFDECLRASNLQDVGCIN